MTLFGELKNALLEDELRVTGPHWHERIASRQCKRRDGPSNLDSVLKLVESHALLVLVSGMRDGNWGRVWCSRN